MPNTTAVKSRLQSIVDAMDSQIAYIEKTGVEAFYGDIFTGVPKADYWVTTGRGRSGHVADKIAASLASTGTPAYFKNVLDDAAHARTLTKNDRVLLIHERGEPFESVAQFFAVIPADVPVDIISDREDGWSDHPGVRMRVVNDCAPSSESSRTVVGDEHAAAGDDIHGPRMSSVETDIVALALGDSALCGLEAANEFTEIDFLMDHPKGALAASISAAKDSGDVVKLDYLPPARQALKGFKDERDGVAALLAETDDKAVEKWLSILEKPWKRVITTGMGKPGYCMRYLVVLLTELGVPSFYVHPAEGVHGDLGRFIDGSLVIGYSHSGTTAEVASILPRMKERGATLLALTNNPDSTLGEAADAVLKAGAPEIDPIERAPTGSTTAALALATSLVMSAKL
jgi:D-arabinose 5-phosphate isomerase GutQ